MLWRVQIKSNFTEKPWKVRAAGRSGILYTPDEIDFLVAYISPRDLWYVFPIVVIVHQYLSLCPDRPDWKYEQYREAWGLFGEPSRVISPPAIV